MWICKYCKYLGVDDMDLFCKNSYLDMDSVYWPPEKCPFFRKRNKVVVNLNKINFKKIYIVK